ncbi:unnamed protein product, partial [marine sediment metagenome]
ELSAWGSRLSSFSFKSPIKELIAIDEISNLKYAFELSQHGNTFELLNIEFGLIEATIRSVLDAPDYKKMLIREIIQVAKTGAINSLIGDLKEKLESLDPQADNS